jgi:hypothetical protein
VLFGKSFEGAPGTGEAGMELRSGGILPRAWVEIPDGSGGVDRSGGGWGGEGGGIQGR